MTVTAARTGTAYKTTDTGAPAAGAFLAGDTVIDSTGAVFVCSVSGSPGTWVQPLTYDADLADIGAVTDQQGDILVRGASGWERLAKSATSTDVLAAGSSQPGWVAGAGGGPLGQKVSGAWYGPVGGIGNATTDVPSLVGNWFITPVWVEEAMSIDALGLEVAVLQASATPRLFAYLITSFGTAAAPAWTATLLKDAGTVDGSTAAVKTATFASVAIPARSWVGLGFAQQGAAGTMSVRVLRSDGSQQGPVAPMGATNASPASPMNLEVRYTGGPGAGDIAGAAPASLPTTSVNYNRVTSGVYMRRA